MRIALLSDIHGNSIALDAVLDDISGQGGVDLFWILGDLAAIGPDPVGVLERVTTLPNVSFARGNTDRYIVTDDRPYPSLEQARADPGLVKRFAQVQATFAWTAGAVMAAGWRDWLAALPLEIRTVLPDGTRLLGVHAAPGREDGTGFHPSTPNETMLASLKGCGADLIAVGHVHYPWTVRIEHWHVVNIGSVSNPLPPDLGANYLILESSENGYRLRPRSVSYDSQAVIDQLELLKHPGREFIVRHLQGRINPDWHKPYATPTDDEPHT